MRVPPSEPRSTRRRLAIFRSHRRGWWSLWIFLNLFVVCGAAEFVANDRPLAIRYQGQWFFPVLHDYSEDAFGPDFLPTDADYTDPDLVRGDRRAGLDDLARRAILVRHAW